MPVLRVFSTLIVVFALATPAAAQVAPPPADALRALDADVIAYLSENNVPGALVAVASRGRLVDVRTYGLADVELSVPVTDSSVFEIGSISKQFVAAAALQLAEEGRLGLDDPIHRYLPGLPGEWVGVTVRQLLHHTSGIPDYEEIRTYDVYRFRLTPEEVVRIAHGRPMDFAPGTWWHYSNTGYFLLSMIVERVDGRPLGRALEARIFEPLGMTETRFADPEAIIPNRASGYWVDRAGGLINRAPTETSSTLGAGGLLTSARDLARWDAALYTDAVLSDASRAEMWTEAVLPDGTPTGYGMGWVLRSFAGLESQRHSGQVAGFNAYFARFPEEETAVIVFLNRYRVGASWIAERALRAFMPALGPMPEK